MRCPSPTPTDGRTCPVGSRHDTPVASASCSGGRPGYDGPSAGPQRPTPDGRPVAIDPNNEEATETIADGIRTMLDPDGLGADGLKIDFTARTPSGETLRHETGDWGVALLRRLLTTVRDAATSVRPDALLLGQVTPPEPSLARSST